MGPIILSDGLPFPWSLGIPHLAAREPERHPPEDLQKTKQPPPDRENLHPSSANSSNNTQKKEAPANWQ